MPQKKKKNSIDFASKNKHATNQTRTINIMAKLTKFQDEKMRKIKKNYYNKTLNMTIKLIHSLNPFCLLKYSLKQFVHDQLSTIKMISK